MPKIVDHHGRRRELAAAAAALVAAGGVSACTVRGLARSAGVSTGVVSHYFSDSREMLFETYQQAHRSAAQRFVRQLGQDGSLAGIARALAGSLPLSAAATAEWKVRIAFWGVSDFGETIRQFEESASDGFVHMLTAQLSYLQQTGAIASHIDCWALATELEALLTGLAIQHLMSPGVHPAHSIGDRLRQQFYRGVEQDE